LPIRRPRRRFPILVWLLAVLLLVAGTACSQPAMTRADARTFAREALTRIGFADVQVAPAVTLASYRSPDSRFRDQPPVRVWQTRSTVPEGTIELYVPRTGNSAVFVRDEATAGGPLLTDQQFQRLRDFRLNPAADRRRDRLQGPTIAAVVLAVIVACALFAAYFFGKTERIRLPGRGGGGGEEPPAEEEQQMQGEEPERQPEPVP
jgi:hypothetical protein